MEEEEQARQFLDNFARCECALSQAKLDLEAHASAHDKTRAMLSCAQEQLLAQAVEHAKSSSQACQQRQAHEASLQRLSELLEQRLAAAQDAKSQEHDSLESKLVVAERLLTDERLRGDSLVTQLRDALMRLEAAEKVRVLSCCCGAVSHHTDLTTKHQITRAC